jgi:hypothetical protein
VHRDISNPEARADTWPELDYHAWRDTCQTLHLWTQIVGKIRLAQTPWQIHSWHATLYVTARGLMTSPIPYGRRSFEIDFDFVEHSLVVRTNEGETRTLPLEKQSVADFHRRLFDALASLDLHVKIHGRPNEVADPIPFADDRVHDSYDRDYVERFHRVLLAADRALDEHKNSFLGKTSPVHFFWGSFDLAVTRFSGRPAPPHPGGIPNLPDAVTREAYSHEVSSAGFWPGGGPTDYAAFYSYAYPAPPGYAAAAVRPAGAFFHGAAGEFLLPYETMRNSSDPDRALREFLESTYEAAADAGGWDRAALECPRGIPRVPRRVMPEPGM